MKLITQIRIKESGENAISKAFYQTGCVLTDGRWIDKNDFVIVKTIYCHYCQNDCHNLVRVNGPNGPRYACQICKDKIPADFTCIYCAKKPRVLIGVERNSQIQKLHYCYRHWLESDFYDEERDAYRLYTLDSIEAYEEVYRVLCTKYRKDSGVAIPQEEIANAQKILERRTVCVPG